MDSAGAEQAIAGLSQEVSTLAQVLHDLQNQVVQIQGHVAQTQQPQVGATSAAIKMPVPDKFSGDRKMFRGFVNQCKLLFMLQPNKFQDDTLKVGWILTLLSGEALAWASPLIEQQSPLLSNFNGFLAAMSVIFDDPNKIATAETTLLTLTQGSRSVAEYAATFRRWVLDTSWNEAAQRFHFRRGLSEAMKDELARVDAPDNLSSFVQLCIKIDSRLSERRKERAGNRNHDLGTSDVCREIGSPTIQSAEEDAMQVGFVRGPISREERQRRRVNQLCLYCGGKGHFAVMCPKKLRKTDNSGRGPEN
ncbi:hypothetical protein XELAEV_18003842mg [Xenopus laevis]|nr:hypothetical protein XELAEV_18003842mg [Xenopus laevis]